MKSTRQRTGAVVLPGHVGEADDLHRAVRVELELPQDGAIDLGRYEKNAVVLVNHSETDLPVGVAESVDVEGGALVADIRFATAQCGELAEQTWQSVREGILAVEALCVQGPQGLELLEISFVSVEAQPVSPVDEEAHAQAKASAAGAALSAHGRRPKPDDEPRTDAETCDCSSPTCAACVARLDAEHTHTRADRTHRQEHTMSTERHPQDIARELDENAVRLDKKRDERAQASAKDEDTDDDDKQIAALEKKIRELRQELMDRRRALQRGETRSAAGTGKNDPKTVAEWHKGHAAGEEETKLDAIDERFDKADLAEIDRVVRQDAVDKGGAHDPLDARWRAKRAILDRRALDATDVDGARAKYSEAIRNAWRARPTG